jgi:hypothetical protein
MQQRPFRHAPAFPGGEAGGMRKILYGARDFGPYLLLLLLPGGSLIALAVWLVRRSSKRGDAGALI